jgi:phosphoadenosine phosphosulfate reductase
MQIPDIIAKLQELATTHKDKIVFSTSFSFEDQLITHLILANQIPIRIFTLDTGRMFAETYRAMYDTSTRYKHNVQVYFPDNQAVENLVNEKGLYSFYDSVEMRKECCFIRKVQPLKRALAGMECWITGIRAEHSPNRQTMQDWEWDADNKLHKFHPLLHWSTEEVETYVRENHIPYNKLHDQGFPSIGCQPCTRAVAKGDDMRAGRWWWEDTRKKECGLHGK